MINRTTPGFWGAYNALPERIQRKAREQFALFSADSSHPSLRFKQIDRGRGLWSARVTQNYRAAAFKLEDCYLWFFIGTHAEYDKLLAGKS